MFYYSLPPDDRPSWRQCLWASTAPLVLTLILILVCRSFWAAESIEENYRVGAREAVKAEDFEAARLYYSRLVGDGDVDDLADKLNLVFILQRSGDQQSATELLNGLAPDDAIGFGPAHRVKAIALIQQVQQKSAASEPIGTPLLKKCHWHLRRGVKDQSGQSHRLWAAYYLKTGQVEQALDRLASAATQNSLQWLVAADVAREHGEAETAERFLDRAKDHAERRLEEDPNDVQERLLAAHVLIRRDRLDEAESLLDEGLQRSRDSALIRTRADLSLRRVDQFLSSPDLNEGTVYRRCVQLLDHAFKSDPGNPGVYSRLLKLYERVADNDQKEQMKESLYRSIVDGTGSAFAHFALGNMHWQDNSSEQALFHLEQALDLAPQFLDVANNLAWLLTNQDPPQLDRAEELIRAALRQKPDSIVYRDTLALVLLRSERWKEALVELERLLPRTQGDQKVALHRRLAEAYRGLSQPELARRHLQAAGIENVE